MHTDFENPRHFVEGEGLLVNVFMNKTTNYKAGFITNMERTGLIVVAIQVLYTLLQYSLMFAVFDKSDNLFGVIIKAKLVKIRMAQLIAFLIV